MILYHHHHHYCYVAIVTKFLYIVHSGFAKRYTIPYPVSFPVVPPHPRIPPACLSCRGPSSDQSLPADNLRLRASEPARCGHVGSQGMARVGERRGGSNAGVGEGVGGWVERLVLRAGGEVLVVFVEKC